MRKLAPYLAVIALTLLAWTWMHGQVRLYLGKPPASTWRQISGLIYPKAEADDGMVFDPAWLAGYATDMSRFKYLSLYDPKKLADRGTDLPERLWVFSLSPASGIFSKMERVGYTQKEKRAFFSVTCALMQQSGERTVFDFVRGLGSAAAVIDRQGVREQARKQGDAWVFGPASVTDRNTVRVEDTVYSFGQERRRSIRFDPAPSAVKSLVYENVPMAGSLKVLVGLADSGRKYDKVRSVVFRIKINGEEAASALIDENNPEQFLQVQTGRFGPAAQVSFEVAGRSGDVRMRHIFFRARSVAPSEKDGRTE